MKKKKKKGARSESPVRAEKPAAGPSAAERIAQLEEERVMLEEEVAMLREEWHQEVNFLQGKLADSERARQELAAWIASADHHESPEDPHRAWMDQLEHDLQATQDEAYRLGARVWALRQIGARLARERHVLESRIAEARVGTERGPAAERRRAVAELTRHSNSLRGTRRDAADDLRLLRTDLAGLLGSSARLNAEIDRARAATAGGVDAPGSIPLELIDRVQVASSRAVDLAAECERLNQQVSALDSEISAPIPRVAGSPQTVPPEAAPVEPEAPAAAPAAAAPEPAEGATGLEVPPRPPSEDITLGFRLREQMLRQRAHLQHWEKIRREMAADPQVEPPPTAPPEPTAPKAPVAQVPPAAIAPTPPETATSAPPAETPPAEPTAPPGDSVSEPTVDSAVEEMTEDQVEAALRETTPPTESAPEGDEFHPAEIFILDDGDVGTQASRRLQEFGFTVTLCTRAVDLKEEVGNRRIVSAAVNLAMPNAWGAVRRLRALYRRPGTRLYAYAMAPDAPNGAWLGPIDLFFLAGEGGILAQIRELEPVLRRVLITTAEPDAIDHIQRELSRGRVATRTIADVRECEATLKEFTPQVGIIHLSPRCFEAFPVMAMLRANLSTRDIPLLFLIDSAAHPRDVAFFSAGLRTLAERGQLDTSKLVSHLSLNLKVTARFLH